MTELGPAQQKHRGDQIDVERQGDVVPPRRSASIAERTSGILASYRKPVPLRGEEERAAFEEALAEEVTAAREV